MKPARRLPSLNALRALEAVRETGSVSAAARRLSVSHSAVSHQVKQLEDWIGRPITVRRGRTVALTEAGESLAKVVHNSFDAIRHEIDLLPLRFARAVSISALPVIAEEVLLPNLEAFCEANPTISLHISLGQTDRPKTPAPDVDIVFKQKDRLLVEEFAMLPGDAIPVCTHSLLNAAGGDPRTAIRQGPLLADEDSRMWSKWLHMAGESWVLHEPARTIYLEGSFLLQKAAENGTGIAICRKASINRALQAGILVPLSDIAIDDDWVYAVRIAAGREVEPEIQTVTGWLRQLSEATAA